ncbi:MAG: EamA family transporter [Candidatus Bilamarchaeaceae archaeon]
MMIFWLPVALLGALSTAFTFVFMKKLAERINEYTVIGVTYLAASLLLAFFIYPDFALITPEVFLIVLANGLIGGVADVLYVRSLKVSEISSVIPLLCLTPIFMLFTSLVMVGEFPSLLGLGGILLVVFGSLMLSNFSIRNILENQGTKLMLFVAFLFSFNANLDKMALVRTTPLVAIFLGFLSIGTVVFLYSMVTRRLELGKLLGQPYYFLLFLISSLLASACIVWALGQTLVSYAITVKRFSVLFGIILGGLLFRENNIGWKLVSAGVMLAGLALIAFS